MHEPHEPKGRQKEESTKSQKQESESDAKWPERNAEGDQGTKNEPKPTARELGAARATQKDSHLDTNTTPSKIRAQQLY